MQSLIVLIAFFCVFCSVSAKFELHPKVTLSNGLKVEGRHTVDGVAFKGLRYGAPPVGKLRWAPAQTWNPSADDLSKTYDASKLKAICPQSESTCKQQKPGCSEDCLYLNLFAGKDAIDNALKPDGELLPVGIFVHGGSYKSGSSNLYPSGELVKYWNGKGIMITVNYRLNIFGFLGSEQLRKVDTEYGSTGNQGIQDQRQAMKWVQDNIQSFGGDPNNVMIFGESAGAGSMSQHLTMKKSFGLYNKVILESGSFSQWTMQPMSKAQSTYEEFVSNTSCNVDDIDCLQALTTDEVNTAYHAIKKTGVEDGDVYEQYSPTNDGVEAKTHPWIVAAAGGVNNVPIILGSNRDEGSMFIDIPKNATIVDLHEFWTSIDLSKEQITKLDSIYLDGVTYPNVEGVTNYWWAGSRTLGDYAMSCDSKFISQTLSKLGQNVHLYFFDHLTHYESKHDDVIPHGSELPFVLHFHNIFLHKDDKKMTDVLATYWGNFLIDKDSNPNSNKVGINDIQQWPQYTNDNDEAIDIIEYNNLKVITGLKSKECEFWIPYIDEQIRKDFPPAN